MPERLPLRGDFFAKFGHGLQMLFFRGAEGVGFAVGVGDEVEVGFVGRVEGGAQRVHTRTGDGAGW